VVDGIETFLKEKGLTDVNDLIGSVEV